MTKNISTPAVLLWLRTCIECTITTRIIDIERRPSISALYARVGGLFSYVFSVSDIDVDILKLLNPHNIFSNFCPNT